MKRNGKGSAQGAGPTSLQQVVGTVRINLDRPRSLKFGYMAIRSLEQETGINLMVQANPFGTPTLSNIAGILWAALLADDPGMTLDGAIGLVLEYQDRWLEIMYTLMDAWNVAMPRRTIDRKGIEAAMKKAAGGETDEATPDPPKASIGSEPGLSESTVANSPMPSSGT